MKQHPILFSTPMVQALLEGNKTMTRRIVKPQPDDDGLWDDTNFPRSLQSTMKGWNGSTESGQSREWKCPYGQIGDILWVREKFRKYHVTYPDSDKLDTSWSVVDYATGPNDMIPMQDGDGFSVFNKDGSERCIPWKPGIHMLKEDCRIFLEITGIRVDRLQDITETDAIAEGIEKGMTSNWLDGWRHYLKEDHFGPSPVHSFQTLWQSINGLESWDENPWVWVVEFKRIEKQ